MADSGGTRIEVKGLRNLTRTLVRAGVEVSDMKAANARVGMIVVRTGSARAPRDSGRLAGSIKPSQRKSGVVVRSSLIYAGVQHWGWPRRNIRATLFLTKAIESERGHIETEYFEELDKIIGKVKGE